MHVRSIVDGKPEGVFSEVAAAGIRARHSEVDAAGICVPSEAAIGEVAVQDVRAPARALSRASAPRQRRHPGRLCPGEVVVPGVRAPYEEEARV